MLEIAINGTTSGVFQKDIAKSQDISNKYLDHIIHELKTANLIANVKGKKSGYILTRKPSEITILDVYNAFEPGICIVECLSGHYHCERREGCLAFDFWENLNNKINDYFRSVTLEDIINKKTALPD
jgi:Rrf2 family protein